MTQRVAGGVTLTKEEDGGKSFAITQIDKSDYPVIYTLFAEIRLAFGLCTHTEVQCSVPNYRQNRLRRERKQRSLIGVLNQDVFS